MSSKQEQLWLVARYHALVKALHNSPFLDSRKIERILDDAASLAEQACLRLEDGDPLADLVSKINKDMDPLSQEYRDDLKPKRDGVSENRVHDLFTEHENRAAPFLYNVFVHPCPECGRIMSVASCPVLYPASQVVDLSRPTSVKTFGIDEVQFLMNTTDIKFSCECGWLCYMKGQLDADHTQITWEMI